MGLDIVARALRKDFEGGTVRALNGMDLDVAPGEHIAIMGPTGCGKSTLLSILALLERPDGGQVFLGGVAAESIRQPELWRAEHLGIVFQFHHLLPYLTVEENVMLPLFGAGLSKKAIRREADEVLETIGLGDRRRFLVTKLSGGERQLTAVARAMVARPSLVLADEPTGSVDSRTGERVLEVLLGRELLAGATVILVTHDPGIAARADRIVLMSDGGLDRREPMQAVSDSSGKEVPQ